MSSYWPILLGISSNWPILSGKNSFKLLNFLVMCNIYIYISPKYYIYKIHLCENFQITNIINICYYYWYFFRLKSIKIEKFEKQKHDKISRLEIYFIYFLKLCILNFIYIYNLCTKLFLDDRKIRCSVSKTFNYMQLMEVSMENYHKQKNR